MKRDLITLEFEDYILKEIEKNKTLKIYNKSCKEVDDNIIYLLYMKFLIEKLTKYSDNKKSKRLLIKKDNDIVNLKIC